MTICTIARNRCARLAAIGTALIALVVVSACRTSDLPTPARAASSGPAPSATRGLVQRPVPATVGSPSAVQPAQLISASPSCRLHRCSLVARADGFGDPGGVVALLAWDRTDSTTPNYVLLATSGSGTVLWHSPDQRIGHVNGYERFTLDGRGRVLLPLAAEPRGQIMVVLEWRAGRIDDRATLTTRRFYGDSVVYAEDRDNDGIAEIMTQSTEGVADADVGGIVESVYTLVGGDYRLTDCRQREGESFKWIDRPISNGRCGCERNGC